MFQVAPVTFVHPFFQTTFADLPPNETEALGVPLEFKIPDSGELRYKGNILLFAREKEGEGIKFEFNILRTEKFIPHAENGDFTHEIYHQIDKGGGEIKEKMILAPNGEVKEFLEGRHRSEMGKFDVLAYKRTPFFPSGLVKVGDSWTYEEEIIIKLHSFWVKQKEPSHKKITAKATLKGFTTAAGRRVAVIHTEAEEKGLEEFSVLFKAVKIETDTKIEEIIYFDYANGLIVRRLTNTLTHTSVVGLGITDVGKSQAFFYLEEEL